MTTFPAKRQRLIGGTLHLNRLFARFESWRAADIKARAEILVEPVLSIWPYFGGDQPEELVAAPRGRRPTELQIFGKTLAVSTWRDVLENTVNEVIEIDPDAYGRPQPRIVEPCRKRSNEVSRGPAASQRWIRQRQPIGRRDRSAVSANTRCRRSFGERMGRRDPVELIENAIRSPVDRLMLRYRDVPGKALTGIERFYL